MENTIKRPHSEEYFGEYRNHWWNNDYVELLGKRWGVESIKNVLDIGCGVGHWGRVLLPVLPPDAQIHGVDKEEEHLVKARSFAAKNKLSHRLTYSAASVFELPFPDNTFDMVTCQTVLIHLANVPLAIREMKRVLKPGGLMVAAEPNNAAANLVEDSLSVGLSVAQKLAHVELALTCEKGKAELGEGFDSVGDLIPGLFVAAELNNVSVFLNDKAAPLFPPYDTPEQQANTEQTLAWADSGFFGFDIAVAKRYFIAGGGTTERFFELWEGSRRISFECSAAGIRNGTINSAGGSIFYIISGRKKRDSENS